MPNREIALLTGLENYANCKNTAFQMFGNRLHIRHKHWRTRDIARYFFETTGRKYNGLPITYGVCNRAAGCPITYAVM